MVFKLSIDDLRAKVLEDLKSNGEIVDSLEMVKDKWGNPWLFLECGSTNNRYVSDEISINSGLVGVCLNFDMDGQSELSLQFSNFFAFGYYPQDILNRLRSSISDLFGMGVLDAQAKHLHEIRLDRFEYLSFCIFNKIEDLPTQFAITDFGQSCFADMSFKEDGWVLTLTAKAVGNELTVRAPIEVLEFREFSFSFEDVDRMIQNSEYQSALAEIERLRDNFPHNLLLNRYQAFCYLSMNTCNKIETEMEAVFGDENLTFLSVEILDAISRKNPRNLLKCTSQIGNYFTKIFDSIEQVKSLDMVMPDLLSEGWKNVALDNAILCLQRMAEKRGVTKILYNKMVDFISREKSEQKRTELIQSLLKHWTPSLISEIDGSKFVQILWDNKVKETAFFAKEFASKADISLGELIALVKIIELSGDIESCLSILERKINTIRNNESSDEEKIALHLEVSRLWIDGLGRIDFAKERLDKLNISLLRGKEMIEQALVLARKVSHQRKEVQILIIWLEENLDWKINDQNSLHENLQRLIETYENHVEQREVEEILDRYIDALKLPKSFIIQLVNYPNLSVNWEKLVANIYKSAEYESDYNKAYAYYVIGRISQNYPMLDLDAGSYFESALAYGFEAKEIYEFFLNSDVSDEVKKAQILFGYLRFSAKKDLRSIYNQLLPLSHLLTDEQSNCFAIDLYLHTMNDMAIQNRLAIIENDSQIDSFIENIDKRRVDWKDNDLWSKLLVSLVSHLSNCKMKKSLEISYDYLIELESYIDLSEVYALAIRYLADERSRDFFRPYLHRMILDDFYPDLPMQFIIQTLQEDALALGRYYMHLGASTKKKHKPPLYRKAISCLQKQKGEERILLECLQELDACSHLTMHEFRLLMNLCKNQNLLDEFAQIVVHQLEILPRGALDLDLFHMIKDLVTDRKELNDTLLPVLFQAVNEMQFDLRVRLLQDLFLLVPNKSEYYDLHFAYDFLSNYRNWQYDTTFKAVFTWIASEEKNSLRLLDLCRNAFRRLLSEGETGRITLIIDYLRQFDIRDKHANWSAFKYFVSNDDVEKAREHWFEGIQILVSKEDVKRYLKNTSLFLSNIKTSLTYESCIRFVYEDKNFKALDLPIFREISLEKYLLSFKKGDFSEYNYHKIYDYYMTYPDDSRVWIPLFKLMQIYDQNEKLASLVQHIIGPLRENPSVLDEHGLSLSLVEEEYSKISGSAIIPNGSHSSDSGYELSLGATHQKANADTMVSSLNKDLKSNTLVNFGSTIQSQNIERDNEGQNQDESHNIGDGLSYDVPLDIGGKNKKTLGLDVPNESVPVVGQYDDWRQVCKRLPELKPFEKDAILKRCKSKQEAHLSSQILSVLGNDYDFLKNSVASVWESPNAYFYKRTLKLRKLDKRMYIFDAEADIYRFSFSILSLLGESLYHESGIQGEIKSLGLGETEQFMIERVDFSDDLFKKSRLLDYRNYWLSQGYSFFNHSHLAHHILYQAKDRSFYFDLDYWRKRQNSQFYHAISIKEASLRLGFDQIFGALKSENILAVLNQTHRLACEGDAKIFSDLLVGKLRPFQSVSKDEVLRLRAAALRIKPFKVSFLRSIERLLSDQLLYLQLYQSLDFIGILGLIEKADITVSRPGLERLMANKQVLALFKNAANIQFDAD